MKYKKKSIFILVLVLLLYLFQLLFASQSEFVSFYNSYVFLPFQSFRSFIFGYFPFSIGDILYIISGLVLAFVLIKWLYFLVHFKKRKQELFTSLMHTIMVISLVSIFFMIGWGGNYYKPSLTSFWKLDKSVWENKNALSDLDSFLIEQLNGYVPAYKEENFKRIQNSAQQYYHNILGKKYDAVNVKPSLFGNMMFRFGVQGYYNPWTGEAQINKYLPSFILPFDVCHEMAHQCGIAAEDDANLLAYVVCVNSKDSIFRYAAYLNLWLYTQSRLRMHDSVKAKFWKAKLNPISLANLDTLKAINKRYSSKWNDYSSDFYDGYLRFNHQKEGIESYNKVVFTAWEWEQKTKNDSLIELP